MITALALGALALVGPLPEHPDDSCKTAPGELTCFSHDHPHPPPDPPPPPPPKPTRTHVETPGGSNTSVAVPASPIVWSRAFIPHTAVVDPVPCQRTSETATEIVVTYGAIWLIQVTDTETGELLAIYTRCEWPGEDPPQPPPMPQPPGETDVETQEILALEVGINPPVDGFGGLTQLDTWFWCDDPGIVDVEARTSGSVAAAQVGITELVWTVTGPSGDTTRTSTTCGTEPDPDGNGEGAAATWAPTQTGDHTITLGATWEGTWTATLDLDGYGWVTAGPFDLAPISITGEPLTYPVVQIQTVGGRP